MKVVNVYPMYNKSSLTTRGSVDVLRDEVSTAARKGEALALDLTGIRIVTPSFLDQLLFMLKESLPNKSDPIKVLMMNAPPGVRDRMESIGRYHRLKVVSDNRGDWLLSDE
jgi:hypothetical protein